MHLFAHLFSIFAATSSFYKYGGKSINKYQDLDFSLYNDAIICLRTSSEHPVTEAEKEKLLAGLPDIHQGAYRLHR